MIKMFQRTVDLHVHTDNSPDGNHSAMFICEKAEFIGLRAIAFCDHCEVDSFYEEKYDKRILAAYFEAVKAQSAFCGKVLVLKGIELGQPHYNPELANKILSLRKYDEVIGSVHNLRDTQDFYFMEKFTYESAKNYFGQYLDELLLMLEWGNFDVLAHMTYPLRYFYSKSKINLDLADFKDKIDLVLRMTAEKDKALEVNSAGLRQPVGKLSPEFDLIKRFKELGGKYVTFGSDAHFVDDLSAGIDESYQAMLAAGFKDMTLFQHRTPLLMPIE